MMRALLANLPCQTVRAACATLQPALTNSRTATRSLASVSSNPSRQPGYPQVFNRSVKLHQREWAASHPMSKEVDYLREEVAVRLSERILDIKQRFSHIADIGAGPGCIVPHIADLTSQITLSDSSKSFLYRDPFTEESSIKITRQHFDEEQIPFTENSLPCIISSGLTLHWTNALPSVLFQIQTALEPDGVFIGAMLGGDSLYELRSSFQAGEMEREGGMGSRVSPMTNTADVGSLLSRAGFVMTTVDTDMITVNYPSPFEVMHDLQLMGESSAPYEGVNALKRDHLLASTSVYNEFYGKTEDDGSRAFGSTFQVIYMIGWKPGPNQPKPLPRGSATKSFQDL